MFFIDILLLLFLSFFIMIIFQTVTGFKNRQGNSADSLKRTQQISRQTALFSGMSQVQEEQYRDSMSMGVCFSRFALQVAAADGQLTQTELLLILHFFKGADAGYIQHIQSVLAQDISNPSSIDWQYNLEEARRILQKPSWQSFIGVVFDGLVRVCMSDGAISEREKEVIFTIMEGLGWSRETTSSWFSSRSSDNTRHNRHTGSPHRTHSGSLHEARKILGVPEGASAVEIKKRYRELVREHHPDRYASMGEEMQKSATSRFQTIQRAYETLEASFR